MTSAHPPFAHNPHVYNGIDPDGNPTTSLVVTSREVPEPEPAAAPATGEAPADDDTPTDLNGDGKIDGYEVFTKAELVAECEQRGLATSGNKPDLVARLTEHDQATAAETTKSTS